MKKAPTKKAAARNARERDLRDMFDNIIRRDRRVAAAIVEIVSRCDVKCLAAIGVVVDFAVRNRGGR